MQTNLENLETAIAGFLANDSSPTPERIRSLIAQFRCVASCSITDSEAEMLARRFEMRHGVTMTIGSVLKERGHAPWLDSARATIDPYYWRRFRDLLRGRHFSGPVIAMLDEVTDRILGLLQSPADEGPWDRRGMVVGHVQSGKTDNYTGLICKAADAGYRLIVVIAGIHNNLRNQTQRRIDEGFVGRDSARLLSQGSERLVGVGRYDQTRRPVTFTNSVRDFNKQMATSLGIPLQNLKEPAVFVIKKNSTTLKNLIDWLREHSTSGGAATIDTPMLLIDDEADHASINIRYSKDEVSRINGQLRELLTLFSRSCYVGYTATPFANIFIDPQSNDEMLGQDLFPRHFIVSLDPPSNYFGPDRVFIDAPSSVIRYITDAEDLLPLRHKIDLTVCALPSSLLYAIRAFVIARAIRLSRGHTTQHCSMLVNASRFTEVQRQLRNEIHSFVDCIQASARVNGALRPHEAVRDPEISALQAVYRSEYTASGVTWDSVLSRLHAAAAPIKVIEVNSRSSGSLNYIDYAKTGLNVIAVGGLSLSRGLTLEGLMTSYFLRNSMMYDTLMQMGRWFGYREGYDDLCRVWMPEEAEGWYAHIAESVAMLQDELRRMEAAGARPAEFGLKVRSHPDTLIVTARNKVGSGETVVVNVGLANQFVETHTLKRAAPVLARNLAAAVRLVDNMECAGILRSMRTPVSSGWLMNDVPVDIIRRFLDDFENHPGSMLTDTEPIQRYIEAREKDELGRWDVLFASLQREPDTTRRDVTLGFPIACQRRTAGIRSDSTTLLITNRQRVASRGVERTGLTEAEIGAAERSFREQRGRADGAGLNYPDRIYRAVRRRPLLIVHLLDVEPEAQGDALPCPIVAWSISFPTTEKEESLVQYVVNTTWLQEYYQADDESEVGDE